MPLDELNVLGRHLVDGNLNDDAVDLMQPDFVAVEPKVFRLDFELPTLVAPDPDTPAVGFYKSSAPALSTKPSLLGRLLSAGRSGTFRPRLGRLAAAAVTFCADGRLLIFGGSSRLACSRLRLCQA